eukprot:UN13208
MKISGLSASTDPKSLLFFKFNLQTSLFKFYLRLQSSRFFRQIGQFQIIKNLSKKSKIK